MLFDLYKIKPISSWKVVNFQEDRFLGWSSAVSKAAFEPNR